MSDVSIAVLLVLALMAPIAIPNFVKARQAAQRAQCHANLNLIQGAKDIWALELRKRSEDVPTDQDLCGPGTGKTVREKPQCPWGRLFLERGW